MLGSMMTVKNQLRHSATHGIGIFASEDIKKGQLVWTFHPGIDLCFSKTEWDELLSSAHPSARENIQRYAYKSQNNFYLCVDNAQFMNHSNTPNVVNDASQDRMYAARDIQSGEELLCDYRQYSDPDDPHLAKI